MDVRSSDGIHRTIDLELGPNERKIVPIADVLSARVSSGAVEIAIPRGNRLIGGVLDPAGRPMLGAGSSRARVSRTALVSHLADTALEQPRAHSFPIRYGPGLRNNIRVYNPNDEEVTICLFLHFGEDKYTYPLKTILAHEYLEIDLDAAKREHLKDELGRVIPVDAVVGSATLVRHTDTDEDLLASLYLVDVESGLTFVFDCVTCPPGYFHLELTPLLFEGLPAQTDNISAVAFFTDGSVKNVTGVASLTIPNQAVAKVTGSGSNKKVTYQGKGKTTLTASYTDCFAWAPILPAEIDCFCLSYFTFSDTADIYGYEVSITGASTIDPGASGCSVPTTVLTVDIGQKPPATKNITVEADWDLQSGGHSHETAGSKRPVPRLKKGSNWAQSQNYTISSSSQSTTAEFRPSRGDSNNCRGIAGEYNVTAEFEGQSNLAKKDIDVKYTLSKLGSGKFCKRSVDSRHNNGDYHWGSGGANSSIVSAALSFWNSWGKNQSPKQKIVSNDQSLKWGGLFEVPNSTVWKANNGHVEHRDGEDVDIPYKVCENGTEIPIDPGDAEWDQLEAAVEIYFNCDREDSLNHFHCRD